MSNIHRQRILIAEDEPSMLMGLADNLTFEGYDVGTAGNGEDALRNIDSEAWDLIILDVMMPKMSGFDVLKAMRKQGIGTPVIMLTARGQEMDRVLGLELGADDYIVKPFSLRELLARVKAVLRRTDTQIADRQPNNVEIGKLIVNFQTGQAWDGEGEVDIPHREMELLRYLWKYTGEAVSRERILEEVWGYHEAPTSRTVDNFIVKLRQKIELEEGNPRFILSVHGVGYKLVMGR
jgi:DNA-binding response OmpR family regulator